MKVCAGLLIDRLIRAPPPAKFATMMEFTAAVENAIGRKIDSPVCRESKAKLQSVP